MRKQTQGLPAIKWWTGIITEALPATPRLPAHLPKSHVDHSRHFIECFFS